MFVELALNTSTSPSIKYSPYELLYGREIRIPGEQVLKFRRKYAEDLDEGQYDLNVFAEVWCNAREHLTKHQLTMKGWYDKKTFCPTLEVGQEVFVKNEN